MNLHRWGNQQWLGLLVLLCLAMGIGMRGAWAQSPLSLPPGMGFVAQDAAGAWGLHHVDQGRQLQRLATQQEPRQACVAANGSRAVYAAADGSLRLLVPGSGTETVIARADARRAYTQPCLDTGSADVVAVEMADGKSLETDILRFAAAGEPARIARQPGAQHDPFLHRSRWLVYASVGCSDGCDELLVEIWSRDLLTGKARQLTLLNALSQGPVTDGQRVVFSSNASGGHQLWQVGFDGSGLRRLTDAPAQATQPALCGGDLYFVLSGPGGSRLARLAGDGAVLAMVLPGLTSVRSLRCL